MFTFRIIQNTAPPMTSTAMFGKNQGQEFTWKGTRSRPMIPSTSALTRSISAFSGCVLWLVGGRLAM
jgi:hypothetical protein